MAAQPKLVLVLTENWTMMPGADLKALVRMAREAEGAGFDAVMLSEHVVLGPDASAAGIMDNPATGPIRETRTRLPPGRAR